MDLQAVKQRFGIIGNSPGLNNALSIAVRVAPTNLSVLITGESGVGKEIFSQIIHHLSTRKHSPFIAVNCGAIPEGTIDSELFGHEKGAFTGAYEARKGYFEYVKEGTIFLDEIGEMPLNTQARLLRVLESGEFIRVGSSTVQKTDVRILAATNVELQRLIERGKFREDLYYRLNTVPIKVPPLRERQEDIYLLFRKFTADFAEKHSANSIQLEEDAQELLRRYPWPGNIRQLKNMAEQMSVLSKNRFISSEELVEYIPDIQRQRLPALRENAKSDAGDSFTEREILYKLIFDIKKDLNDLKKVVIDMSEKNGEDYSRISNIDVDEDDDYSNALSPYNPPNFKIVSPEGRGRSSDKDLDSYDSSKKVIISPRNNEHEVVDESLSLSEQEKELIIKALKKHKSKRKDAASDLGISERTLYRKIKEYNIPD